MKEKEAMGKSLREKLIMFAEFISVRKDTRCTGSKFDIIPSVVLLQFCTYSETSNKKKYPTFARTRPPDTQISKSVASVLLEFNWTHVSLYTAHRAKCEFLNNLHAFIGR